MAGENNNSNKIPTKNITNQKYNHFLAKNIAIFNQKRNYSFNKNIIFFHRKYNHFITKIKLLYFWSVILLVLYYLSSTTPPSQSLPLTDLKIC